MHTMAELNPIQAIDKLITDYQDIKTIQKSLGDFNAETSAFYVSALRGLRNYAGSFQELQARVNDLASRSRLREIEGLQLSLSTSILDRAGHRPRARTRITHPAPR
jgi:hypothetical protein